MVRKQDILTETDIKVLFDSHKTIVDEDQTRTKAGHKEKNFHIKDEINNEYQLFLRQNKKNVNDFSCGIALKCEDGNLTLMRCNGNSHKHTNQIEKTQIEYKFHIHIIKAHYITAGKKADGYAEMTNDYSNIEGAFKVLLDCCNIPLSSDRVGLLGVDVWK